ncbi:MULTISPECIES: hypothetical protein [unclassified Sinorhizobium]|uniref:hypothetical protein n=1 Tax=unclassified Sinorhizobium TaxID=2613772 RepID=UPI003525E3BD
MKQAKKTKPKPLTWKPKVETKTVVIDNPYYSRAHDADGGNRLKIEAHMNLRESPVAMMAARGHIEPHQLQAAFHFRLLWEALGGAGAGAIDYTKEPVDGGGSRDPISLKQLDAGRKLNDCREVIGPRHYDIVRKVAGEGQAIASIVSTQRERNTMADYLRDGLEDLAAFWGYKTAKNTRKTA